MESVSEGDEVTGIAGVEVCNVIDGNTAGIMVLDTGVRLASGVGECSVGENKTDEVGWVGRTACCGDSCDGVCG